MLRAVIYCRVSTKEQTKNLSLPVQEKACRDYCNRNGYEVAAVFVEEGESAKTADRTKFKELLTFCRDKKNRIDAVVVNSVNRFSRDKFTHFTIRALLSKLNITLRSVTEPIDDTSTGKLMEGVLASFSPFDNDVKAERTKDGMKAAIEEGRWPFPVALGYLKIPQEGGRSRVVLDPKTAPLVRQAFEVFATGRYERAQVLQIVTAAGLCSRKGKKLSEQSFCNLLKNPFYAGKLVISGWEVDGKAAFKPIISDETFRLVQSILAGRGPTLSVRQRTHPDFSAATFRQMRFL